MHNYIVCSEPIELIFCLCGRVTIFLPILLFTHISFLWNLIIYVSWGIAN